MHDQLSFTVSAEYFTHPELGFDPAWFRGSSAHRGGNRFSGHVVRLEGLAAYIRIITPSDETPFHCPVVQL